MTNHN